MNLFVKAAQHRGFSMPLHSLRGVAALVVLFSHIQTRVEEANGDFQFPHIFNGSGAVTFFFVLSGLVVGAALAKQELTYNRTITYLHRRFFRIMPLLVVTVSLGGLYLFLINDRMQYPFYDRSFGDFSLTKLVAAYFGYSLKPNPPIWSIYIEIIGSLLIPLMILTGSRAGYILLAVVACVGFSLVNIEFQHHWNFYMITFYLGLTILLWGQSWANFLAKLPAVYFWMLVFTLAILFYGMRMVITPSYGALWIVYWETAMITPLVAAIYYLPERFSLLARPAFTFLGDVSYSLYLTHWMLLVVTLNLITPWLGTGAFSLLAYALLATGICLIAARFSYKYIELNGVKLGEQLRHPAKTLPGFSS